MLVANSDGIWTGNDMTISVASEDGKSVEEAKVTAYGAILIGMDGEDE